MSQRPDDFYADYGQFGASDELRPVYERLDADARAWSATVGDETRLIAFARSLSRRSREETMRMQSQPDHPEWETTQHLPYSNPDDQPRQRLSRLRTWVAVIAAALVVALLGGSFYALQTARNGGTTGTPTATTAQPTDTPLPTATATATPLPTASASQLAACGMTSAMGVWSLGDLLVTPQSFFGFQTRKLPDGTRLAPFQLSLPAGEGFSNVTLPAADPVVNPNLGLDAGYGYMFDVCNSSSSQTHILKGIGVRIEGATPYSGQLNAWNLCDGGVYDASAKQIGGGCGGGVCAFNETLKATFETAAVGASATVTQVGWHSGDCIGPVDGPLPVSLKPHSSISLNMGIALPSSQATYTFAFGVAQDSAATVFLPPARPILLAPVAHKWTGEACLQPTMQSQIPAASSPTYYICPAS